MKTAYPLLKNLSIEEQAAMIAQAEAGEALTLEQAQRIGLPAMAGVVLLPVVGKLSASQMATVFSGREGFWREVARLAVHHAG